MANETSTSPDPGGPYLYDPLTGVLSRIHLSECLQTQIGQSTISGSPFSLLMLDLDHFKSVNDAFGHQRGDQVLIEFTRRLGGLLNDDDLIFRYGGDEFILLLPDKSRAEATKLGQRLLEMVHDVEFSGNPPLTLSMSVGVACYPHDGLDAETLFDAADQHHYEAKRSGRNRVVDESSAPGYERLLHEARPFIQREEEVGLIKKYLTDLETSRLRTLFISGPPGAGKTRLLAEASKLARLQGFMTLSLSGTPSRRHRLFGALLDAIPTTDLPSPLEGENRFVYSLDSWMSDKEKAGFLVLVDNPEWIDPASLELVQGLVMALKIKSRGILVAQEETQELVPLFPEIPLRETIELSPLSVESVETWLESGFPGLEAAFLSVWLNEQTQGWPGKIQTALDFLVQQDLLKQSGGGWTCQPGLASMPLEDLLSSREAAPPFHLPMGLSELVGREEVLTSLKQLILANRLVSLIGPGGIGKTRLAIQVGLECLGQYADGVFFVPADTIHEASDLVISIADAIDLRFSGKVDLTLQILHYLEKREMLLILDNLDHLGAVTALLTRLVEEAPDVRLLVTSRDRFSLPEEMVYKLNGLDCPSAGGYDLEQSGAARLFLHAARRINPGFSLSPAARPTLAQICNLVEGLPLAIELAATWVNVYSMQEIAAQIENSLGFLHTDRADFLERHRSLVAVFDSFWNMLSPTEQMTLCKLSVFNIGFSSKAALYVAGASPFFLDALATRSFLRKTGVDFYEMHELLRRYSLEKLQILQEDYRRARELHCQFYTEFLQSQRDLIATGNLNASDLFPERENLRLAWSWAVENTCLDELKRGVYGLYSYNMLAGHFKEGEISFGNAIDKLEDARQEDSYAHEAILPLLAQLYVRRAGFLVKLGLFDEAISCAQKGVRLAETCQLDAIQAEGFLEWGDALRGQGDFKNAAELLKRSLEIADRMELPILQVDCLYALGGVAHYLGDNEAQLRYAHAALKISESQGDLRGLGKAYNLLAIGEETEGDYSLAKTYFERSIKICREAGDRRGESIPLINLGALLQLLGNYALARNVYEQFLQIKRNLSDRPGEIWGMVYLSLLFHQLGNHSAAEVYAHQALLASDEIGDRNNRGNALNNLGHALDGLGEYKQAAEVYQQALNLRREMGQNKLAIESLAGLARVRLAQGKRVEAQAYVDEILVYLEENSLDGSDDPFRVWLTCVLVLEATDDARYENILSRANNLLLERAEQIQDADLRRSFLGNVAAHKALLALRNVKTKPRPAEKSPG